LNIPVHYLIFHLNLIVFYLILLNPCFNLIFVIEIQSVNAKFPLCFVAPVENVFKIGSVKPGAMLFDAAKEFEVTSGICGPVVGALAFQHCCPSSIPTGNASNLSQATSDTPSPTRFHRFSTRIFMTTMKIGEGVSDFARDKLSTG